MKAREGDMLVVKLPEQKIGIPTTYSSITLGGDVYTRKLSDGDDVEVEYERVLAFLRSRFERHARAALAEFTSEVEPPKRGQ